MRDRIRTGRWMPRLTGKGAFALAAAAALLVVQTDTGAAAQDRVVVVEANPAELSESQLLAVASARPPMTLELMPNQSTEDAVRSLCGNLPSRVMENAALSTREVATERQLSVRATFPVRTLVSTPFCFARLEARSAPTRPQNLWQLVSQIFGAQQPRAGEERYRLVLDPEDPHDAALLRLLANQDAAPSTAGAEIGRLAASVPESVLMATDPGCARVNSPTPYQLSATAVRAILDDNAEIRTIHRLGDPGSRRIAIFDSGIEAPAGSGSPFDRSFVQEPHPRDSASAVTWPLQADSRYSDHAHGTYVASAAWGGAEIALANQTWPQLRALMTNVVTIESDSAGADHARLYAHRITTIMSAMRYDNIAVINLSMVFRDEMTGFPTRDSAPGLPLIVVAAGNNGLDLETDFRYPASLGSWDTNVLTVAALGPTGALAHFSNYGRNTVEIAAPGCAVEVLERGQNGVYARVPQSGTSLAAPLVSFTAALIARESGLMIGRDLKWRILHAADVHPYPDAEASALPPSAPSPDHVAYGRVLNIEKAIRVFEDVVETNDGRLLTGEVRFRNATSAGVMICRDVGRIQVRFLRKIAHWRVDRQDRRLVFYISRGGAQQVATCPNTPIQFQLVSRTGAVTDFTLQDTRDIVFTHTGYWGQRSPART